LEVLAAIGIEPYRLLQQIINFGIILWLLQMFLYKPLLRMMAERKEKIRKGLEDADKAREALAGAQTEYQKRIDEARKEGQGIIAQATQSADRAREEILAEARVEAQKVVAKAKEELEYERKRVLAELRQEVASLAVLAAGRVIKRELDDKSHRQLVEDFLAESGRLN
jgi:F-type H+-transporting ATPase subunit b